MSAQGEPCEGVEDQAAIKETVESVNRLGHPEFIVRLDNGPAMTTFSNVLIGELKERFGVRAIPPGGTVEKPSNKSKKSANVGDWHKKRQISQKKVRTLVIATRELDGAVVDVGHVVLVWCVRFADHSLQVAHGFTNVHFSGQQRKTCCV